MIAFIREVRRLCPWNSKQTIQTYKKEFLEEAQEVAQAIDNKDYPNLKEELGDVIWDAMMIAHIAEQKGYFKAEEVLKDVTDKMKRRKPYIVEGRKVTLKQAWQKWHEVKAAEKVSRK